MKEVRYICDFCKKSHFNKEELLTIKVKADENVYNLGLKFDCCDNCCELIGGMLMSLTAVGKDNLPSIYQFVENTADEHQQGDVNA